MMALVFVIESQKTGTLPTIGLCHQCFSSKLVRCRGELSATYIKFNGMEQITVLEPSSHIAAHNVRNG